MNKDQNYQVYITQTKGTKGSNHVNFFHTKYQLPLTDCTDQLLVALEDLKQECNLSTTYHPNIDSKHDTPNITLRKMKELFGPVINKASKLLSSASILRVQPSSGSRGTIIIIIVNLVFEMLQIDMRSVHTLKMNLDSISYKGKITSDNGK